MDVKLGQVSVRTPGVAINAKTFTFDAVSTGMRNSLNSEWTFRPWWTLSFRVSMGQFLPMDRRVFWRKPTRWKEEASGRP